MVVIVILIIILVPIFLIASLVIAIILILSFISVPGVMSRVMNRGSVGALIHSALAGADLLVELVILPVIVG